MEVTKLYIINMVWLSVTTFLIGYAIGHEKGFSKGAKAVADRTLNLINEVYNDSSKTK